MKQTRIFEKWCLACIWVFAVISDIFVEGRDNCSLKLVTGPYGVQDDHLSATSYLSNDLRYAPKQGRLHAYEGWIANEHQNQFLQVSFDNVRRILAVQTHGRSHHAHWLKSYAVSYNLDNEIWIFLKDNEGERIFTANTNQNTVVTNVLPEVVVAKHFRIHPRACYDYCALRFELLGCNGTKNMKSWRVHPIVISDFRDSLWNKSAADLGQCATSCFNHESCQSFVFNGNGGACTGFGQEFFHGYRLDVMQGNHYFLNAASLDRFMMHLSEKGYTNAGNVIYKIYTNMVDIISAKNVCQSDDTDLLTVRNLAVLNTLQKVIASSELLVDGSQVNGKWVYNNVIDIPENLWADGQPSDSNGNCVVVAEAGLNVESCLTKQHFICRF